MARHKGKPNYSAEEKAFALTTLTMRRAINPEVPLQQVADELNLTRQTLSCWDKGEFISDEIRQKIADKQKTLADYHDLVGNIALVRLVEQLTDDEKAQEILARDLNKISVDQRTIARLDRGEATSISATVSDNEAKYLQFLIEKGYTQEKAQEIVSQAAKLSSEFVM